MQAPAAACRAHMQLCRSPLPHLLVLAGEDAGQAGCWGFLWLQQRIRVRCKLRCLQCSKDRAPELLGRTKAERLKADSDACSQDDTLIANSLIVAAGFGLPFPGT